MKFKLMTLLLALVLAVSAAGCKIVDLPEESSQAESSQEESEAPEESPVPEPAPEPEPLPDREEIPEAPLATLGENQINSSDYVYFYNMYLSNAISMYGSFMDIDALLDQEMEEGLTFRGMLIEEALGAVKEYSVFYQTAVADGQELTQEEITQIDDEVKMVLDGFDGDEQVFLNQFYLTPAQITGMLRRNTLATRFMNESLEAIAVTDQEIAAYYEANREALDKVTVRHILIDCTTEMTEEEQAAAKAKAEDILSQIKNGGDFVALAAEHSTDPGSKDTGGEYTFGINESYMQEFKDWSFAAQPGDQGIVQTDYGYHVMEKIGVTGFEDVDQSQITSTLKQEKFRQVHSAVYEQVASADWVVDQELLDLIIAA